MLRKPQLRKWFCVGNVVPREAAHSKSSVSELLVGKFGSKGSNFGNGKRDFIANSADGSAGLAAIWSIGLLLQPLLQK